MSDSLRFAVRRSIASGGLLLTIAVVVFIFVGQFSGISAYLKFNEVTATREYLSQAAPTARSIQIETRLSENPENQSAIASIELKKALGALPVSVTRTLTDYPLPVLVNGEQLQNTSGFEARITPGSDEGLEKLATLVDGVWPSKVGSTEFEGVLQADAAKALGLRIGDLLNFGSVGEKKIIEIVGTWRAKNPLDPHWFSNPGVATGLDVPAGDGTASYGPLFVDESTLEALGPTPFVHWTLVANTNQIDPESLQKFGALSETLGDRLQSTEGFSNSEITVNSDLATSIKKVQEGVSTSRGVSPIGSILLALAGLFTLSQLSRLLTLSRRAENALLRSRGASAIWLTSSGLGEVLLLSIIASTAGIAVSTVILVALFGTVIVSYIPWITAPIAILAVILIFGFDNIRASTRIGRRDEIDDSGRSKVAIAGIAAGIAIAAAIIATWQSISRGSPIVIGASGQIGIDPLVVSAPAITLIATSFCLLLIFQPTTRLWSKVSSRVLWLQPSYSARQVARRISSLAVAFVIVAIAVGSLMLAVVFSGSSAQLARESAQLAAGSDLRISIASSSSDLSVSKIISLVESKDPQAKSIPGLSAQIAIGDSDEGRLLGLPAGMIRQIVPTIDEAINTTKLSEAIGGFTPRGIELPKGATSISIAETTSVQSEITGGDSKTLGYSDAQIWLQNLDGDLLSASFPRVELGALETGENAKRTLKVNLPKSNSSWWIVAIDSQVKADGAFVKSSFDQLVATSPSGSVSVSLMKSTWKAELSTAFAYKTDVTEAGMEITVRGAGSLLQGLRMMDVTGQIGGASELTVDPPPAIPIVISTELAEHYDLKLDRPFLIRFAGSGLTVSGKVAKIATVLPGPQSANIVLVDLPNLYDSILRSSFTVPEANQVWISTAIPDQLIAQLPTGTEAISGSSELKRPFTIPAEVSLWIAGIGTLAFGAISLGAVCASILRARRDEVPVLRSLGISAREQGSMRFRELSTILLASIFGGIAIGIFTASVTLTGLVRSTVPDLPSGIESSMSFEWLLGLEVLVAAALLFFAIVIASSISVHRAALDTSTRVEVS
ncbi:MAG: ABC transporter permease [Microbacteriaceae bacterium]|nr:ABC transporter permease [Cryobacterium sp.]MCC6375658.1 ABC transporter permease [Microbacteriaceae bacterium]